MRTIKIKATQTLERVIQIQVPEGFPTDNLKDVFECYSDLPSEILSSEPLNNNTWEIKSTEYLLILPPEERYEKETQEFNTYKDKLLSFIKLVKPDEEQQTAFEDDIVLEDLNWIQRVINYVEIPRIDESSRGYKVALVGQKLDELKNSTIYKNPGNDEMRIIKKGIKTLISISNKLYNISNEIGV